MPSIAAKRPLQHRSTARTTKRAEPWAIDDYLSYLLARASHVVASEFHLEVRAAGLTILEWRVLATLADGTARNVGALASIALAQQSTVTKLLGRMEAEGRIARADGDHDRRQSLVRITLEGRAALGTLLSRSKRHERIAVERLDQGEAASLKSALRKLIDGS
ncbi:MAG: MarR family winged helix-turn-helix transcriptional regulator [Burkholderiaceae bacterium]